MWKKWVSLYKDKMLSRGEYLGDLYDIGFDRPEAHAIRKSGAMYYAFYAPQFQGKIELRGLERKAYKIHDYENNRDLGVVQGPTGSVDVQFSGHLLLEAQPNK
jgi:alpha-galactosidase